MKQLLWKELRENLKWGLLGFLFVYFMLMYGITQNTFYFESSTTLSFYSLMAAFLGFALGFVQIFSESAPDRWAFLMHRPVSAKQIVQSKVIVGISLLFAIWLIAIVLVMIQLVSLQKLNYPMYWFRLIPAVISTLIGIPAYLSGLMFVIWKPRWKFTRLLFLGPVACYCMMRNLFMEGLTWNYLWVILLVDTLITMLLLMTVLNVFQVTGEQVRATRIARITTQISTSVGVIILMFMLFMFIGIFVISTQSNMRYAELKLGANGEVYRVVRSYDNHNLKYLISEVENVNDPQDKLFQDEIVKEQLAYDQVGQSEQFARNSQQENVYNRVTGANGVFRYGKQMQFKIHQSAGLLVVSNHEGLLFEYQSPQFRNRYVVTSKIGKNGYLKPYELNPESFGKIVTVDQASSYILEPLHGKVQHDKCLVVCSDAIYKLTPHSKSVELIYSAPKGSPIMNVQHISDDKDPIYLIEHPDSFRVFTAKKESVRDIKDASEVFASDLSIYLPGKEIGLIQKGDEIKGMDGYGNIVHYLPQKKSLVFMRSIRGISTQVVEVSFDGKIISQNNYNNKELRLGSFDNKELFVSKLAFSIVPPVVAVVAAGVVLSMEQGTWLFAQLNQEEWLIISICVLFLIITILIGQWYCRRCQFDRLQTRRCFWATLLLGPAGLIAFWVIEEPPHLEPCGECGKLMSVRFDVCPACGTSRGDLPQSDRNIIADQLTLVKAEGISSQHPSQVVPS